MAVTIAEVARRAGVSKTTVSRVLNERPDVDELTATRVRKVIAETGYARSARAVGLARGSSRTVGMLVPSLTWPWMADVLQGAVDVLEVEGYGLLLYTTTRGQQSLAQFATQVDANSFDGLLVIEPPNTLDYIESLHRRGLPVVLIDDRGHHPQFPSVATTNREGATAAAHHILGSNRNRPAMISGPDEYGCVRDRARGFIEAFTEAGIKLPRQLQTTSDFSEQGGHDATLHLLKSGKQFDALFAHNDLMAVGAMRALRSSGRRIPDDVAVIGFDDIPLAAHTEPPLTTVRQPSREMAATAARALIDRLEGGQSDPTLVLPTSLVVRRSAPDVANTPTRSERRSRRSDARPA